LMRVASDAGYTGDRDAAVSERLQRAPA
jgi:hypothetical protein